MIEPRQILWILVCDGASARLYRRWGRSYRLIDERHSEMAREKTSELLTDRAGRVRDRFGAGRHRLELPADPKLLEKQHFVEHVAARLNQAAIAGRFHKLIVTAAPQALHHLRLSFTPAVQEKIVTEISKDLVTLPEPRLFPQFDQILVALREGAD